MMFTKLIDSRIVTFLGQVLQIRTFQNQALGGRPSFSSEVILNQGDHVILDDPSLAKLEKTIELLIPFLIYSRVLTGTNKDFQRKANLRLA